MELKTGLCTLLKKNMIKRLDWDSDFFGYEIGQTEINSFDQKCKSILLKETERFKLVYIISDNDIYPIIENAKLVDIKIQLIKEVLIEEDCKKFNLCEYKLEDNEQLKKLAFQSGIYSRFKRDINFTKNEYEKLYAKWIEDSINKLIADNIIVYKNNSKENKGFITIKHKIDFTEIGLIAVDELSRGKGIGVALLNYVNNLTKVAGLKKIVVTTQFENIPAMKLYERAGYKVISKKYIYHLWN